MTTYRKANRGDVVLLPIAFNTVDQRDIVRKIGTFSPALMEELPRCIEAALKFS